MRPIGSFGLSRSTISGEADSAGERAGAEAVHAHAVRGPVDGEVAGHLENPAFERVVRHGTCAVEPFVRVGIRPDEAVHRPDHHDAAAAPGDGVVAKLAGEEEVAGGVGELAVELLGGDRSPVGGERLVAVVDEHVDVPGPLLGLLEPALDRILVHMIQRDGKVHRAVQAWEACDCSLCLGERPAAHDDRCASFGEGLGHARNPGGRSRR